MIARTLNQLSQFLILYVLWNTEVLVQKISGGVCKQHILTPLLNIKCYITICGSKFRHTDCPTGLFCRL